MFFNGLGSGGTEDIIFEDLGAWVALFLRSWGHKGHIFEDLGAWRDEQGAEDELGGAMDCHLEAVDELIRVLRSHQKVTRDIDKVVTGLNSRGSGSPSLASLRS